MNSEIMPGWMDYTVIRSIVCLFVSNSRLSRSPVCLFYSILFYLSLPLSLVRSLLSIDPSMTSEERREREREREREVERERERPLNYSFFGNFWYFFLLLLDYII